MARPPSHYDVLEISSAADEKAIRRAYRRQAQRWHPDRNGGTPEANERFIRIRQAYEVLSSPALRRKYDAQLASVGPSRPAPPPSPIQTRPYRKGDSLHLFVSVPLRLLVVGGYAGVRGRVGVRCPRCRTGCRYCRGSGQILVQRQWRVWVPAGHSPEQWLRFSNAGHTGPYFSHPGDVFIKLAPKGKNGWEWNSERARLERRVKVPAWFMRQGGLLEFMAPHGREGYTSIPPSLEDSQWVFVRGPGIKSADGPAGMWLRLEVGLWFSWGTRRFR